MEHVRSVVENLEVSGTHENLAEEIRELEKRRTAVMMEKCLGANGSVICPKPRKRHVRQCEDHNETRVAPEFSDYIINKASPPYFSGSPPIRTSNPLIQDANFHDQRITQVPFHCSAQ